MKTITVQDHVLNRWGRFLYVPLLAVILCACGHEDEVRLLQRGDIVVIDTVRTFGELERPPVMFLHDVHTLALQKQNKDCTACHISGEKGILSQKFQRLENESRQAVTEIYHKRCVGCHKETAKSDAKSGPVTCGECHNKEPSVISSLHPMGFDLSLHSRHIEASGGKCEACHHQYDEAKKAAYYAKGQEVSCRDCHRAHTEGNRESMRLASHQACIGCHRAQGGPQQCSGCHDSEQQQAIKRVESVPRLKRGQPNAVLLHAAAADLDASKMNTVPFNHAAHEGAVPTCRLCHHETVKACKECHKLEKGDNKVTLQTAMHDRKSHHSCIGCHEQKKQSPQCAGCHSLMQESLMSEYACTRCHSGPRPDDPMVREKAAPQSIVFSMTKAAQKLSFPKEKIPENVTIGALEEHYEKVVFPHRKIITTLLGHIGDSKVATYLHGTQDLVCQGCHHHTPASAQPPLCGSCHSKPFNEKNLYMPRLLAAYHLQCIGCHKGMGIKKLSGCTDCHKDRGIQPSAK